jgi:predicted cobalt transporter CbtA
MTPTPGPDERPLPFGIGTILGLALIAGLTAGLVAAAFHTIATEPLIERAIALEEQMHHTVGAAEPEPVVSREMQRVGLWLGLVIYGVVWALLFAPLYHLAQRWLPGRGPLARGLTLALLGFLAVGLLPALKYPANPPGVGDPDTINLRQTLYVTLLGLSVLSTAVAVAVGRWRGDTRLTFAVLAVLGVLLYVLLPPNPDATPNTSLILPFRALSLVGVALFWAVLGGVFTFLLRRKLAPSAAAAPRLATGTT